MDLLDFPGLRLSRRSNWYPQLLSLIHCLSDPTRNTGYVGRIMLHNNPWDGNGFNIQICCLIIAPAFFAAGIYLTLKHIALEVGSIFSRLRPKFYTWIFILCDIFSLILQGAGGGIAASASGSSMQKVGGDLMMAGIVWQVFTLVVFSMLVCDYAIRVHKRRAELEGLAVKLMSTLRFNLFIGGLILAYITILTRCVFRIGELANGWANSIMQNEIDFILLDGVMITIAVTCLTAFHPGHVFPEMQMHSKTRPPGEDAVAEKETVDDVESTPASLDQDGRPKREHYFGAA